MAPMKVMKGTGKAMTKGAIAKTIAEEFELKQNVAGKIIDSFAALATKEVQANGIFSFPGLSCSGPSKLMTSNMTRYFGGTYFQKLDSEDFGECFGNAGPRGFAE